MASNVLEQQIDRQLQSLVARHDWDEVIYQCKAKIASPGTSARQRAICYSALGKAFVHRGENEAAIAAYRSSIAYSPQDSESHYALGILYSRQEKPAKAICHYQKALEIRPQWIEVIFGLARLFHRLGSSAQAYEAYQKVLAIAPEHVDTHVAIGVIYEQRSEPRLAIKHYQRAAYLQPDRVEARRAVGRVLIKLRAYDAAIDVLNRVLKDLPNDAQSYSALGQVLLLSGNTPAAVEAYRSAVDIDKTLVSAHRNLGRLHYANQDLSGAISCYREALRQVPDNLAVLSDYATVLTTQGDWDELIESFRLAVRQQPDWIERYCRRTVQLSEQDLLFRMQRTSGRFLIALQQAKSDEMTTILKERLGQIYEYLGDLSIACDSPSRAEQCYQRAVSIRPDALQLYAGLGDSLRIQGRLMSAIAVYQAGLSRGEQTSDNPVQTTEEFLSSSDMTYADWLSQLSLRKQQTLFLLTSRSSEPTDVSTSGEIKGVYLTAQDWQRAQESDFSPADKIDSSVRETSSEGKCGGITCQMCMGQLIQSFSPVQVGKQSFHCSGAAYISTPPTFTLNIPNGRAWSAPQKNSWDVCNEVAVFADDDYLIGDLSRSYPWYLPGCTEHKIQDHTLFKRQKPLPKAKYIAGNVAFLSSLSGHIYYHWMFDVLPRIDILKQHLATEGKTLADIDYFVVNSFERAFQEETLSTLGIPTEKVIASDLVPHIQAQNLYAPSFPGHMDWVPPRTLTFLRDTFLKLSANVSDSAKERANKNERSASYADQAQTNRIKNKRLYITRKQAKYRHVFNETAIVEMLSQFGFVSVALETLSVAEQIALFAQAEVIVAPHGSGLSNIAFCQPETTIIECFSPNYMRSDYWMISQHLKLNHYYLIGQSFECQPLRQLMYPSGLTEDFSVDLGELRSLLRAATIT